MGRAKKGAAAGGARLGRPRADEPYTKVTMVLRNDQVVALDRLSADIREGAGKVVQRAQLVRAFVDAVLEAGLEFADAGDESAVKAIVAKRLGGRRT